MNFINSKGLHYIKAGEGNDSPLQYSCLENFMYRGAWKATVHGGPKELDTTESLTHHQGRMYCGQSVWSRG